MFNVCVCTFTWYLSINYCYYRFPWQEWPCNSAPHYYLFSRNRWTMVNWSNASSIIVFIQIYSNDHFQTILFYFNFFYFILAAKKTRATKGTKINREKKTVQSNPKWKHTKSVYNEKNKTTTNSFKEKMFKLSKPNAECRMPNNNDNKSDNNNDIEL